MQWFVPIRVILPDVYNLGNDTVFRRDPDTEPLRDVLPSRVVVYRYVDSEHPRESSGNVGGDFTPSSFSVVLMPSRERHRRNHTDYSVVALRHGRRREDNGTVVETNIGFHNFLQLLARPWTRACLYING